MSEASVNVVGETPDRYATVDPLSVTVTLSLRDLIKIVGESNAIAIVTSDHERRVKAAIARENNRVDHRINAISYRTD